MVIIIISAPIILNSQVPFSEIISLFVYFFNACVQIIYVHYYFEIELLVELQFPQM